MTTSKGAMRAAKEISREGYDGSDHGNVEPWKEQDLADVATIIDRETKAGLLLEALTRTRYALDRVSGGHPIRNLDEIFAEADAAIAAAEAGEG